MARRGTAPSLHVVGAEPPPTRPRRQTVAQAAQSGDHMALLVAMRDRIAKAVSAADCSPRDLASLTRRLNEIATEIQKLKAAAARDGDGAEDFPDDEDFDPETV